jgi:catechol 2,3-dioxygenase-like lactoylglutathione lyase family enzyme
VSTEYRLNHFGLLCQDVRRGLATYCDDLGNEMTSRWYNRGLFDLAFVGNGPDTTIELVGPPFLPYEEAHLARHGYSINHLSFRVDDADVAFEELRGQGVQVAWEPQDMLLLRQCGFLDEDGLLFEVFSYLSPLPLAVPDVSRPHKATDLRLHHVSILTPDLRRSQRFYTETLGMRTLLEYVQDDGGFIFLVDPAFDLDRHSFMLEIIGPPHLEPREVEMLEARGACYDHLCYVADDVQAAWQGAVRRGVEKMAEPAQEYGTWIAWVRDADGNDLEIMNPIPEALVETALHSEEPVDLTSL